MVEREDAELLRAEHMATMRDPMLMGRQGAGLRSKSPENPRHLMYKFMTMVDEHRLAAFVGLNELADMLGVTLDVEEHRIKTSGPTDAPARSGVMPEILTWLDRTTSDVRQIRIMVEQLMNEFRP